MLLGNLGAHPELRTTSTGHQVLKLSLATTVSYFDKNKQKQQRTEWHTVKIWGKRGEALSQILRKGTRILVEGRIESYSYEKDGQKRYGIDIVADDVWFAGSSPAASQTTPDDSEFAPVTNGSAAAQPPTFASFASDLPF